MMKFGYFSGILLCLTFMLIGCAASLPAKMKLLILKEPAPLRAGS